MIVGKTKKKMLRPLSDGLYQSLKPSIELSNLKIRQITFAVPLEMNLIMQFRNGVVLVSDYSTGQGQMTCRLMLWLQPLYVGWIKPA